MIYKHRKMPEVKPWQLLLLQSARKGLECNAWVVLGRQTATQRNGARTLQKRAEGKSSAISVALALFGEGGGCSFFPVCFVLFSPLFQ